jgi:hypothetical protein
MNFTQIISRMNFLAEISITLPLALESLALVCVLDCFRVHVFKWEIEIYFSVVKFIFFSPYKFSAVGAL